MNCAKAGCRFKVYSGRLCYQHTKEAAGFVFDRQAGKFVRASVQSSTEDSVSQRVGLRIPTPEKPERENGISVA
jgi:hypothetical protein